MVLSVMRRVLDKLPVPLEFRRHYWAAHKEMLLAVRSVLDVAIERVEKPLVSEAPKQPEVEVADDLTTIRGIGARVQARLNEAGVTTYVQLASLTPEQVAEITGRTAKRIAKEEWILQARTLVDKAKIASPLSTCP